MDRGPAFGPDGGPDVDEERYLEIWNLVFMQDACDEQANVLGELPRKNIDTGSSLERVAMIVQDVPTVFDTDLMRPLVEVGERLSGRRYGADAGPTSACGSWPSTAGPPPSSSPTASRPPTRAAATCCAGCSGGWSGTPGALGVDDAGDGRSWSRRVVRLMGGAYPELVQNRAFILQVAASEEERFGATYRQGFQLLEQEVGTGEVRRRDNLQRGRGLPAARHVRVPRRVDGRGGGRGGPRRSTWTRSIG